MTRIITRQDLRDLDVCYSDERIDELVPSEGLTLLEGLALDIPAADKVWVACASVTLDPPTLDPLTLRKWLGRIGRRAYTRAVPRCSCRPWDYLDRGEAMPSGLTADLRRACAAARKHARPFVSHALAADCAVYLALQAAAYAEYPFTVSACAAQIAELLEPPPAEYQAQVDDLIDLLKETTP